LAARVLVTRPEPGLSRSAERLAALGWHPVLLPLTETRTLATEVAGEVTRLDAFAVSSANALRHADRGLLDRLANVSGFAVGARTADAAVEAGLAKPRVGPGDGEGLAAMIAGILPPRAQVAYLCGRVRSPGFEGALVAAGLVVVPIETYDTVEIPYGDQELTARLGGKALAAALVYSRRAAEALARVASRPAVEHLFEGTAFLCISQRALAPLSALGGSHGHVARAPTEEAMLALLGRAL
jgi:uroporphyrinogen-III synthase